MMKTITISSRQKNELIDITSEVESAVSESGLKEGVCLVYCTHTTAAIKLNENADPNIAGDFLRAISRIIPEHDGYRHDEVDNNAAAHIRAGLIGCSKLIPVSNGKLMLGKWQNVFICEFDGPRKRNIIVKLIEG